MRPGAIVNTDLGRCRFNFVFAGSDGSTYIGTAGRCILGDDPATGEMTWAPGQEPLVRDASGATIGEFVYAIVQDPKDFALIRVDPGVTVEAQMCQFGGPTGVNSDTPLPLGRGPVFLHYITSVPVAPGQTGFAFGMPDPDHVFAQGLALPQDTGSAVISNDGRAVGALVTLGVQSGSIGTDGIHAGTLGITRIAPQVARAEEVLGIGLTLQTAPRL